MQYQYNIVQLNILNSNITQGQTYSKQTMQECVIINNECETWDNGYCNMKHTREKQGDRERKGGRDSEHYYL